MANSQAQLAAALQQPEIYDHATTGFEVIETHISWVILTGRYAYKIKKAVDLGFLNFSTLAKREFYCRQELRLNRRLAPELYLDVIPIYGEFDTPRLRPNGPVIEYAVKMLQFEPAQQLDRLAENNRLDQGLIEKLTELIADFHSSIGKAPKDSLYGEPETVRQPLLENFEKLSSILSDAKPRKILDHLQQWEKQKFKQLKQTMISRKVSGYIRECHGDMHLGNIVLHKNRVTIFDCIEFNESLRWIDVMSELAFLVMDLDDRGQHHLGFHLLNRYLEITGDYHGVSVLYYYLVYRATVRAKVAAIRHMQTDLSDDEKDTLYSECLDYLRLADGYSRRPHPFMIITHGLSGSGKTTLSGKLADTLGIIRIRSDVERKRLFGLTPEQSSDSAVESGIYSSSSSRKTYEHLAELSAMIINAGIGVIIDAAFLNSWQREIFRNLADTSNTPLVIASIDTDVDELERRIEQRIQAGKNVSEANLAVLRHQQQSRDRLTENELCRTIRITSAEGKDVDQLIAKIEGITRG